MILIVDDEPAVLAYMEICVRQLGLTPVKADSVHDAIGKLQSSGPLRLLITDISMPGHDGLYLAEQARKRTPDLPVLFVSGHAPDLPGLSDWLDRSRVRFLKKPFSAEEIRLEVERLIA